MPPTEAEQDYSFYPEEELTLFQRLCEKRGWTDQFLADINAPDYDVLKDLDTLVEALHRVRISGEQIVVLPDYDMDGVTSGTLGWAGLNELGFNAELYIPDHRRGHDISPSAIDELREQFPQATTIITCDGGVNSTSGVQRAHELGLKVFVTDHHVELSPGSSADITVNPARIDETYSNPGICGAFVLYQVIQAYADRYAPEASQSISLLKLFAGIGTVSDVMPLKYENRQIVRDSLSLAQMLYVNTPESRTPKEYQIEDTTLITLLKYSNHSPQFLSVFEGFALTLKQFHQRGKLRSVADLSEEFYGFYLAPTFNAIRRVDAEMAHAFGVFMAPTSEEKLRCVGAVIDANERRKTLTEEHMNALDQLPQLYAPHLYFTTAPKGMHGLMAAKLMEANGLPTIVLNIETLSGSARSPFWFPVVTTMTESGFTAVGHENACGVSVGNLEELVSFVAHFKEATQRLFAEANQSGALDAAAAADLTLGPSADCDADFNDIDELQSLTKAVERLRPFGQDFPQPEFELLVNLTECEVQPLGSSGAHLRITTPNNLKLLWWSAGKRLPELLQRKESNDPEQATVRCKVRFSLNRFRGSVTVQAIINEISFPDTTARGAT